jgi:hypothetical protein
MMARLQTKLWIWAINHGWMWVDPWRDPRRPVHERAQWIEVEPKSANQFQYRSLKENSR